MQPPRATPSDIAFTPTVKDLQRRHGSRSAYEAMERTRGWSTTITPELAAFIADLDMFYLATANAEGQPYIQYRGGPRGFLKVLDDRTLAFADFAGNRQFLSWGNLEENPRAFLFLIDYSNRRRVKAWGTARFVTDDPRSGDPELIERLHDASYRAKPERALLFSVEAFDVNCPQHIHPRVLASDAVARIAELEAQVRELTEQLATRDA